MCGVPGVWGARSRRGWTVGHCVGAEQRESRLRGEPRLCWGRRAWKIWGDLGGRESLGSGGSELSGGDVEGQHPGTWGSCASVSWRSAGGVEVPWGLSARAWRAGSEPPRWSVCGQEAQRREDL